MAHPAMNKSESFDHGDRFGSDAHRAQRVPVQVVQDQGAQAARTAAAAVAPRYGRPPRMHMHARARCLLTRPVPHGPILRSVPFLRPVPPARSSGPFFGFCDPFFWPDPRGFVTFRADSHQGGLARGLCAELVGIAKCAGAGRAAAPRRPGSQRTDRRARVRGRGQQILGPAQRYVPWACPPLYYHEKKTHVDGRQGCPMARTTELKQAKAIMDAAV